MSTLGIGASDEGIFTDFPGILASAEKAKNDVCLRFGRTRSNNGQAPGPKRRQTSFFADVRPAASPLGDEPRIVARYVTTRQDVRQDQSAGGLGADRDDQRRAVGSGHFRGM